MVKLYSFRPQTTEDILDLRLIFIFMYGFLEFQWDFTGAAVCIN